MHPNAPPAGYGHEQVTDWIPYAKHITHFTAILIVCNRMLFLASVNKV